MDSTKFPIEKLNEMLKAGEPWLMDIDEDEKLLIFHDIKMVCWCCGSIRSEHHFIKYGSGITYDHIIGYCVEPYVEDACRHAWAGSRIEHKCPFKDTPDAMCK